MALPGNLNDREQQKFRDVESGKTAVSVMMDDTGIRGATYYGRSFGTTVSVNMPTAAADTPILLFKNPTGSGKRAFIWRLRCGVEGTTKNSHYHKWANSIIAANGTEATPCNCNSSYSATTPACKVYSGPTVTNSGTQCDTLVIGADTNSALMLYDFECILEPNSHFLITGTPNQNNTVAALGIKWVEESI